MNILQIGSLTAVVTCAVAAWVMAKDGHAGVAMFNVMSAALNLGAFVASTRKKW